MACEEAECETAPARVVELVIVPRSRDIGNFEVRRCLPTRERRSIGPFVFFDEMGPAELRPDQNLDVRPHPHIALATITYLFEGAIMHRDSLGNARVIEPGAINLMVAGRGITHSERTPEDARGRSERLHGLQLWIALPEAVEEMAPAFHHHPASTLPSWEEAGVQARLLMGEVGEHRSPVQTFSETLYVTYSASEGASWVLPEAPERGLYVVEGEVELDGERFGAGTMLVLSSPGRARVRASTDARSALVAGSPLGRRYMDWNFVSSRLDRIRKAKEDWRADRFPVVFGDEVERVPYPGDPD